VRLYWEVARRGFRRYATYRAATVGGIATNTVFGFIRAYVYVALFAVRPLVGGWDLADTLTYTFLTQGLLMALYLWGWNEIADTIRSGDVATHLSRPFDYQFYWLSQDLGRALYHLIARGIPPFLIAGLVFDLRVPASPATWIAFAISVALAVTVSFAMRFMVNLSAFWILEARGVHAVFASAWTVLSGFMVPIAFFPDGVRAVLRLLPFAAMVELPMDVFLAHVTGPGVLSVLALQAFWAAALLAAGRLMLGAVVHKLVVQGG